MKTVTANIKVTATDNLSPDSSGKISVMIVSKVMIMMGNTKYILWNNAFRCRKILNVMSG